MLAVHFRGDLPTGTIVGGTTDAMDTTKWTARFEGEAAHAAAAPEKGRHALAAAAQATLAILGLTRLAGADPRVDVGTFHADGSANLIPALATITDETRSTSNAVLEDLNRRAEAAVKGAAQMYGVTATTKAYGRAAVSRPDAILLDDVARGAAIPAITTLTPVCLRGRQRRRAPAHPRGPGGGWARYVHLRRRVRPGDASPPLVRHRRR